MTRELWSRKPSYFDMSISKDAPTERKSVLDIKRLK